jgi:hypothetical protein
MDHDASRSFLNKCEGETGTNWETPEPKLAEILEEPIVQALMAADSVDLRVLMISLCETSSRYQLHKRNRQSRDFKNGSGPTDSKDPIVDASEAGDVERIRALDPRAT